MHRSMVVVAACLLVAGCATRAAAPRVESEEVRQEKAVQLELVVNKKRNDFSRMSRVFGALARASADVCGSRTAFARGFEYLVAMPNTDRQQAEVLRRSLGVSERGPVVYFVDPNSAAAAAGLQEGDIILSMAGNTVPKSGQAARDAVKSTRPASGEPLTMRVLRSAREVDVTVAHERQCDAILGIATDGRVHAYVKDTTVVVTTGMLEFAKTDDELAIVVGHELAHLILARMDGRERSALFAGLPWTDSRGEGNARREHEADHLGVILAARAGYDVAGAAGFWRRMGVEHPSSITGNAAYPSTAERYIAVEAMVKYIEERRKSGQPLLQGYRDPPPKPSKPEQPTSPPETAAKP